MPHPSNHDLSKPKAYDAHNSDFSQASSKEGSGQEYHKKNFKVPSDSVEVLNFL